jgi:hypothetical protein
MTTAAKRARKKANKLKGWPVIPDDFTEVGPPEETVEVPVATESEHAAAMQALAKAKRMRQRKVEG